MEALVAGLVKKLTATASGELGAESVSEMVLGAMVVAEGYRALGSSEKEALVITALGRVIDAAPGLQGDGREGDRAALKALVPPIIGMIARASRRGSGVNDQEGWACCPWS